MFRRAALVHGPLLALVALAPSYARAQQSDDGEYKAIIAEALSEYQQGLWEEARILFKRAHALEPSARTYYGIGLSSFQAQHYVDALEALEAALVDTRKPLTADQRREADDVRKRATRFVGRLRLRVAPEGATVAIDGVAVDLSRASALVDPGTHEVVASAPGHASAARRVTVEGGSELEVVLELEPSAATAETAAPVAVTQPAVAPTSTAPADRHESGSVWPWIGLAASVAVAGAGGALLGLGLSDASTVIDAKPGTRWSEIQDANDRAVPLQIAGGVALGIGAAGIAACALLLLSDGAEQEPAVAVAVGPGSALLRGRF